MGERRTAGRGRRAGEPGAVGPRWVIGAKRGAAGGATEGYCASVIMMPSRSSVSLGSSMAPAGTSFFCSM